MEFLKFLIIVLGFVLIYTAVDLGRPDEYKHKTWSKNWCLSMALVIGGVIIIGLVR